MTVSPDQRRRQMRAMLIRFVEDVGDHSIRNVRFGTNEPAYAGWLPTSWIELKELGYLDLEFDVLGKDRTYNLTATGWMKGLELAGLLTSEHVRDRAVRLVQFFKSQVDGRRDHYGSLVDMREVPEPSGVPAGWAWNAVASGLLSLLFPSDRMDVELDYRHPGVFRVASTFGQKRIQEL